MTYVALNVAQSCKSFRTIERLLYTTNGDWIPHRKVDNNTYLERRQEGVALLLHRTDVLTWKPDDTVTLNTNGWYTQTTKARMNAWLPNRGARFAQIWSDKGYWQVQFTSSHGDQAFAVGQTIPELINVAYHDGMIIDLSTLTEFSAIYDDQIDRDHNRAIDKKIKKWVKNFEGYSVQSDFHPSSFDPEVVRPCLLEMLSAQVYPMWVANVMQMYGYPRHTWHDKSRLTKCLRGLLYSGSHSARLSRRDGK